MSDRLDGRPDTKLICHGFTFYDGTKDYTTSHYYND